jgi:hypothetical protein
MKNIGMSSNIDDIQFVTADAGSERDVSCGIIYDDPIMLDVSSVENIISCRNTVDVKCLMAMTAALLCGIDDIPLAPSDAAMERNTPFKVFLALYSTMPQLC